LIRKDWAFFNEGISEISYAPFPATVIATESDAPLTAIYCITLDWNDSDLDGPDDIVGYDVYFGRTKSPELITSSIISKVDDDVVVTGNIYYWRIVTKDKSNNQSSSILFNFTAN